MGKFDSAQQMLNLNSIGVDYQPPTPAVREHIIGDDDDAHPASMMAKPFNPANALYGSSMHPHRPNSNLNHRRPPSSSVPRPLPNQRHVINYTGPKVLDLKVPSRAQNTQIWAIFLKLIEKWFIGSIFEIEPCNWFFRQILILYTITQSQKSLTNW